MRVIGSLLALSPFSTLVFAGPANLARQVTVSTTSVTPSPSPSGNVSTNAFPVNAYAALGESFASGPSAGDSFENPNPCRRYKKAFGPQVNADSALQGDGDREFDFIACSGSKTKNIYQDSQGGSSGKPSKSQANQLQGKNPDFVTMSMGGNDIGFVNLLDHCVYRFYDPFCIGCGFFSSDCTSDCEGVIQSTQSNIDGEDLKSGLDSAIKAIFENAPKTHLYLTLYPRFFNPSTTQCNNVQFNLGCAGSLGFPSARRRLNPLTENIRSKMNTLTDNLNNEIKAAVGRAQPGDDGFIEWVDPNPYFEGHRFCESDVTEPSYRNSKIYFYPYEFSIGNTLSYTRSFDNSTDCNNILDDPAGADWGNYFACEMVEAIHTSPNATSTPVPGFLQANNNISDPGAAQGDGATADGSGGSGSSDDLPDFLARIFHPTIRGMTAYKDAIIAKYQGDAGPSTGGTSSGANSSTPTATVPQATSLTALNSAS